MVVGRQLLRTIPLFSSLSDEQLDDIDGPSRTVRYGRNAVLFNERERGDFLVVILSGRVKISLYGRGGKELILSVLQRGDILGEMALLDRSSRRSATATALTDTVGLLCFRRNLESVFTDESFIRRLTQLMNERLRETNDHLRAMATLEIPDRVVLSLLKLARTWGRTEQTQVLLKPRPKHEVLAHLVGCERETVTRALRDLQAAGFITVGDESLIIRERALRHAGLRPDGTV
jgi:CRP/FNR family transcriptional regulator, cyclic AMP receptor protein